MGLGGMPAPQPLDPETIAELEEITKLPAWEDVQPILRSDQRRGYKVDIETEDTVAQDEMEEKNSRMEFLQAITGLMEKAIPMAIQLPPMKPLVKESVMFLVKGFRAGRPLEEAFEEAFAQLEKQPPPEQPNPEMAALQLEEKKAQQTLQLESAKAQQANQLKQMEFAHNKQLREAEMAHTFQLEQFKLHNEMEMENKKLAAQEQLESRKLESQQQLQAAELQHKQALGEQEFGLKSQEFERSSHMQEREFQHKSAIADREHEFSREQFSHKQQMEQSAAEHKANGSDQLSTQMKEAMTAQQEAIREMADVARVVEGLTAAHQELIKAQRSPKRIVRDPAGRTIGVETL